MPDVQMERKKISLPRLHFFQCGRAKVVQINLWFKHIQGTEMHTVARFLLGEFAISSQSLLIDIYVTGRGSHGLGYGHISPMLLPIYFI